jgi:hypothetical protein
LRRGKGRRNLDLYRVGLLLMARFAARRQCEV